MKRITYSAALLAALTLRTFAGTDVAPTTDSKDMKDTKNAAHVEESDAGFYVAGYGGANFDTDYGNRRQTVNAAGFGTAIDSHAPISSNWGGVGGIKAGYNFASHPVGTFMGLRLQPAVEAEAMYIGSNNSSSFSPFGFGTVENQHFSTNSGDFFLNGILRFKNSSCVTPYIGVGAGLQYLTIHGHSDTNFAGEITGINASDLDFAGQALFGLDVSITKHISLFSEYKFVDALGTDAKSSNLVPEFGSAVGDVARFKPDQIMQNLITAGVKYSF